MKSAPPLPATRLALCCIVGLAFALRVFGLTAQSLWRDEVDVLIFATEPLTSLLGRFGSIGENGPLYYLMMRPWIALAGESEFALRFPALAGGLTAVALIGRLAGRLATPAPIVAAALAATSPLLIWYSQDAKMYGVFLALGAAGFLLTLRLVERWGWGAAAAWLALAAATVWVHMFGLLAVAAMAVVLVAALARQPKAGWRAPAGVAVLILVALPVLRWGVPLFVGPPPSAYAFLPIDLLAADLLGALGVAAWPLASAGVLGLSLMAWLLAERRRTVALLWCWIVLPVAVYFGLSFRYPVFTERYFIFTAAPYYALAAGGTTWLWRRSGVVAGLAASALLAAFGWASLGAMTQPIKSDFRAASAYVQQAWQPGDALVFVMPQVEPTFRYYFGPAGVTLRLSPGADNAGLAALADYPRVWLVLSETEQYDPAGTIGRRLTERYRVAAARSFTGVGVTLLER